MRGERLVARIGAVHTCNILVGQLEGNNRPVGRPRGRRKDNIKVNLEEMDEVD